MLNRDNHEAVVWADRASRLPSAWAIPKTIIRAHNAAGAAAPGWRRTRARATGAQPGDGQDARLDRHIVNAWGNLGSVAGELYQFEFADATSRSGRFRDRPRPRALALYIWPGKRSNCIKGAGPKRRGRRRARSVSHPRWRHHRIMALMALGRLRARRGDSGHLGGPR